MKELDKNNQSFEDIKHVDENGVEIWYARELMPILQYAKWQNFKKIIDKAIIACQNSEISIENCFTDISKPIISGKRDKVDSEKKACDTHNKIGKIVRKAIKEAGRSYARRFAYS